MASGKKSSHWGSFAGGFAESFLKAMQLGMMYQHYQAMEAYWAKKGQQPGGDVFRRGWEGADPHGADAGSAGGAGGGAATAGRLANDLMKDYGLTRQQAMGATGVMGYETGNFSTLQEQNPEKGQGGYGYAQWTGPRRDAFEQYVKDNKLDPNSYEANYGFLKHEIATDPKYANVIDNLKKETTVEGSARSFETNYEGMTPGGPGKPAFEEHIARAVAYDKYLPQDLTGGAGGAPALVDASGKVNTTGKADASQLHPAFASRIEQASAAAEKATGKPLSFSELHRTYDQQAEIRARHEAEPGGVNEHPAAQPGHSEHELGAAGDANSGPALDWLRATGPDGRQNITRFGLEFLPGETGVKDPNHIQLPKSDFGKTAQAQPFQPYKTASLGWEPPPETLPSQPSRQGPLTADQMEARRRAIGNMQVAPPGPDQRGQYGVDAVSGFAHLPALPPQPTPPSSAITPQDTSRQSDPRAVPQDDSSSFGPPLAPRQAPYDPRWNSIESQPPFPPVQGREVGPENVGQRAWTPDSQPPLPPVQGREVGPENAGTLPYGQPEARPSTAPAPPYEQNFPTGQVMTGRVPEMLVPTTQMPVDERNLPIPEARPSTVIPSQVMTGRVPEMKTPVAGGDERTQPAGANVPSAAATPASATQPSAAAIPMRPGWGMIERPNIDQAGGGRSGGSRQQSQMGAFDFSTLWGPNPPVAARPQPAAAPAPQPAQPAAVASNAQPTPTPPPRPRLAPQPVVTPRVTPPPGATQPTPAVQPGSGAPYDPDFGHQFARNDTSDADIDQSMMMEDQGMQAQMAMMPIASRKGGPIRRFAKGGGIPSRPTMRYADAGAVGTVSYTPVGYQGSRTPAEQYYFSPQYVGPQMGGGWEGTPYAQLAPNQQAWADQQQQAVNLASQQGKQAYAYYAAGGRGDPFASDSAYNQWSIMPTAVWPTAAAAAPTPVAQPAPTATATTTATPITSADTNTSAGGGTVTGITGLTNSLNPTPVVNPAISTTDTTITPKTTTKTPTSIQKTTAPTSPGDTTDAGNDDFTKNTGGVTNTGNQNYSGFRRGGPIRRFAKGGGIPTRPTMKFAAAGAVPNDPAAQPLTRAQQNQLGSYSGLPPVPFQHATTSDGMPYGQTSLGRGVVVSNWEPQPAATPTPVAAAPAPAAATPAAAAPATVTPAPTPTPPMTSVINSPSLTNTTNTSAGGGTVTGITGLPNIMTPAPINQPPPSISTTTVTDPNATTTKSLTPSSLQRATGASTSGGTTDQGGTDFSKDPGNQNYGGTTDQGGTDFSKDPGNQNYGIGGNYSGFRQGGSIQRGAIPQRASLSRVTPARTKRYDDGGGVSPSPMGMPPGLSGGGGQPIPPVYFNPATYAGAGAPVGKGITNTSMPTYVAGAIPTLPLAQGGSVTRYDDGGDVADLPAGSMYEDNMINQDVAGGGAGGEEGLGFQIPSEDVAMGYGSGSGGMRLASPRMSTGMRGPGMGGKPPPGQTEAGFVDEGNPFQQGGGGGSAGGPSGPPNAQHSSPQEYDPNLPAWAPQVDDGQGNPSRGVIGAIAGGLHYLASALGLGGNQQGAVAGDPNVQTARMNFAQGQGVDGSPLPSDQEWRAIGKVVDPDERLSNGIRNLAGMEAVRNWYQLQGQAGKANQMSAMMLQYSVQLGMKYGDQAVQRFYNNDLQGSIHALEAAKDSISDGTMINASINYDKGGNPVSVNVAGKDLAGKELWAKTVAPQAILGAALGMRDGSLPWHMYEMAAAKYDPATAAIIKARKDNASAEAETGVLKGMYGNDQGAGGGGQGEQPTGRGGAGGFAVPRAPRPMPTPQMIPVQTQGGAAPTTEAQPSAPQGIPSRPLFPAPSNLSPAIQQADAARGGTGGGGGGDRAPEAAAPVGVAQGPDQDQGQQEMPAGAPTVEAGADLNKQLANAPAYDVQDVKDEDILASVRSNYRDDAGNFIGAPAVLGRPDQQPGYTRLAPAQQSEMWRGYNASVAQRRQYDADQGKQEAQEISYQRSRAAQSASDLRHTADQKRQDYIRTQTDIWKENQATTRNDRSIQAAQDLEKSKNRLMKDADEYRETMSLEHPLDDKANNEKLGTDTTGGPMVYTHLANAFLPDAGRTPIASENDAITRLGNAGFTPDLLNVVGPAFKAASAYSTHTPREEVARGVMLLASGHQTPPDMPAVLNKRLGTYDITVLDDNGYAVHLTMPANEAQNLHSVGLKAAQGIEDKRVDTVNKLGESQGWPTPPAPGGGAIPSQATPPKPFVLSPRPERLTLPPRVTNQQVPQEWKDQFPELNQQ